jgi:hypothetical protein
MKTIFKTLIFLMISLMSYNYIYSQITIYCKSQNVDIPSPARSVLYDQIETSSISISSQDFETPYDAFDCQGADDFIVPSGVGWSIESVTLLGTNSLGTPQNLTQFDLFFFGHSESGIPVSSEFKSYLNSSATYSSNTWTIFIPGGLLLGPGHYWVSVVDIMPYATYGQFYWSMINSIYNSIACWRNPGNGFGYGAITWTPLSNLGYNQDFAFSLEGEITPVPVLSLTPRVFSSSGAYYASASSSLSMTVGESIIETYIAQDNTLNTGFQQVETFVPLTRSWNGSIDDNWSLADNWTAAGVPVSIDNVSIPATAPRMPIVRITGLSCRSIDLDAGASFKINSGMVLRICGN